MKMANLFLILSLSFFVAAGVGCKKKSAGSESAAGVSVFSEADKNAVTSAIEAKKYDAAVQALVKLQDKMKSDQDLQDYRTLLKDAATRLILAGDDENAKAALSAVKLMATGR